MGLLEKTGTAGAEDKDVYSLMESLTPLNVIQCRDLFLSSS